MNELALELCHIGKQLQNDIRDQRARQVPAFSRVEQRHIDHADIHILFPRQKPPLILHLLVIAPQPVDALDDEQIARSQLPHQLPVLRAVKILARAFVNVDAAILHASRVQRDQLPLLILILAGNADIAIRFVFHFIVSSVSVWPYFGKSQCTTGRFDHLRRNEKQRAPRV